MYVIWCVVFATQPNNHRIATIMMIEFLAQFMFHFLRVQCEMFPSLRPVDQFLVFSVINFICIVAFLNNSCVWYIYLSYLLPLLYCSFIWIGYNMIYLHHKHYDIALMAWKMSEIHKSYLSITIAIVQMLLLLLWFLGLRVQNFVIKYFGNNRTTNRSMRIRNKRLFNTS